MCVVEREHESKHKCSGGLSRSLDILRQVEPGKIFCNVILVAVFSMHFPHIMSICLLNVACNM